MIETMGSIALCLFAIAAFCLSVAVVVRAWSVIVERLEDRWERRATKMIGGRIVASAHWFSESKAAQEVLTALGKGLAQSGGFYTDSVRDEWRKAMKAEEAK